jgi:hypothetical protein
VPGVCDYEIPLPVETEPYFFDPEDAKLITLGHAAAMAITDNTIDTPAEDLLSYLSHRELAGCDSCDGCYEGHPPEEQRAMFSATTEPTVTMFSATAEPTVPSILDLGEQSFDTRTHAVASSWHRVLHENLHPKQLQPCLAWAPLCVISKT